MKWLFMVFISLASLVSSISAKELLPFETEGMEISTSGIHSVRVDDRLIFFEIPVDLPTQAGRALEVISKGEKHDDWLKRKGEYQKSCFAMGWNFYPLGIPLLGIDAQFSISAKLYVKATPAQRNLPGIYDRDRGDFSKPDELFENLKRTTHFPGRSTPIEELIINNRKWYRHLSNSALYPDALRESFTTGLASDRYLEITIDYYPAPYPASRYPTYPTEDQMPNWMRKTHKYKEQVINSMRITRQEGSNEPDLYEVEAANQQ
ncbi:MAG TPA: hypothetical protein DCK83_01905 [Gallionellaceae bacterium]|nr:hypothetical protein [Gallionellaceae bacterium]